MRQGKRFKQKNQTWKPSFSRLGRNISTIAIPAIAMVALANLPVANADPFTDCIDACDRNADGALAKLICYAICAIMEAFRKKNNSGILESCNFRALGEAAYVEKVFISSCFFNMKRSIFLDKDSIAYKDKKSRKSF